MNTNLLKDQCISWSKLVTLVPDIIDYVIEATELAS